MLTRLIQDGTNSSSTLMADSKSKITKLEDKTMSLKFLEMELILKIE